MRKCSFYAERLIETDNALFIHFVYLGMDNQLQAHEEVHYINGMRTFGVGGIRIFSLKTDV